LGPANAPAKSLGQRLKTVHSSGQKLGTVGWKNPFKNHYR
jgi:hypothetical protein